ncbi:hypothetical protein R3P38DRAFT_3214590 [Favolaschia claudopus]|uniref:Homeobox domain-containing protein n=1 Tax=Favolaschia claudopus TaxID=2862362 RepID=A0AAW0AAN2_9AGAR
MPHGMDPTDYRAFYPYTPNEVKHRKRTTSAQLKVLENIFKRDTKPNAALRTELASQLSMTARGVQVWFQNRRAKEKTKAVKTALKAPSKDSDSPSPRSSEDPDDSSSPNELPLPALSTSESPSPTCTEPPPLHLVTDSGASSWQGSPVVETPEDPSFDLPSLHLVQSRRGSLPINALSYGGNGPLVDPLDPLARRRSVDASLVRLAANPYANIARAKNMATQRLSRRSQYLPRPGMPHRATAPFPQHTRHASMDARNGYRIPPSPSPSPLSPYHAVRASLPDQHLYPVSSRSLAAPIPGPLPNPTFSFGMATTSSDSDRNSPVDFGNFSFPPHDLDTEPDDSSASYQMSRFGSIASESSATSAYYSDVGSLGETPDFRRRESCPTGFLNMVSSLDVSVDGPRRASIAEGLIGNYPSECHLDGSQRDVHGTMGYPSPSSTISPGNSPRNGANTSSSELNYALREPQTADTPTFFFNSASNSPNPDPNYPQTAPASSNDFAANKFYEYGMPYPHGAECNFNAETVAYGNSSDVGYGQGGMEYPNSEQQQQPYYEPSRSGGDAAFTYS